VKPAALVLAGGQARRLGGLDKPLICLGGRTVLAHILDRLVGQAFPIALSANADPARFAAFGLPVLADGEFAGQGPLAGLLRGLDWAAGQGADTLLSIPGDTPFIPDDLVAALAPAPACAASSGRVHHLVALWPVAARAALAGLLATAGPRDVRRFAASLGMRTVDFAAIDLPSGPCDPFLNINTPADLALAERIAEQHG
jgi:molybdopterin-guanine dinucleotide biosynthesis protein A